MAVAQEAGVTARRAPAGGAGSPAIRCDSESVANAAASASGGAVTGGLFESLPLLKQTVTMPPSSAAVRSLSFRKDDSVIGRTLSWLHLASHRVFHYNGKSGHASGWASMLTSAAASPLLGLAVLLLLAAVIPSGLHVKRGRESAIDADVIAITGADITANNSLNSALFSSSLPQGQAAGLTAAGGGIQSSTGDSSSRSSGSGGVSGGSADMASNSQPGDGETSSTSASGTAVDASAGGSLASASGSSEGPSDGRSEASERKIAGTHSGNGDGSGGVEVSGKGGGAVVVDSPAVDGAKEKGKERKKLSTARTADVPADCDLYHGRWVPDPLPPVYSNATCKGISQHQNCQGNGRPDSGYERWQWKPKSCDLPRFDAHEFARLMRRKSILFVGDSVARNQMESLVCLLSQVEEPAMRGSKRMLKMIFPKSRIVIARVWSAWLVHEGSETVPGAAADLPRLHLDRVGEYWAEEAANFEFVVLCSGHWYVKPSVFMLQGGVVGGQKWTPTNLSNTIDSVAAFHHAIRTVFSHVVDSLKADKGKKEQVVVFRTYSPDHYENGEWNTGGSCAGLTEPRQNGYIYKNAFADAIYGNQLQAFNEASKGLGDKRARFVLMDIMPSAGMRVDGHPGPFRAPPNDEDKAKAEAATRAGKPVPQDCLHWCLPGPIDTWNVFLLQIVKRSLRWHDN